MKKIELTWPGKFDDHGNLKVMQKLKLPFQIIERVNETQTTRNAKIAGKLKTLIDDKGWKNELIWGDNKIVMSALLEKFAGKIDLIYLDPPFATGTNFSITTEIGDQELSKKSSIIEEAYRDSWGQGNVAFLQMIYERLMIMRELLNEKGTIYVHTDWHIGQYVKIILDEIFGQKNFLNEVIWCYGSMQKSKRNWNRKHDNIFVYTKSNEWTFNALDVLEEYEEGYSNRFKYKDENGYYMIRGKGGSASPIHSQGDLTPEHERKYPNWTYRQYKKEGGLPKDWWEIPFLNSNASERVSYDTQKPEEILAKIIKASSNPGDMVADFFCGSGTTLVTAEKLGRRWIGVDIGRYAIHTTRKRLMNIENCKPFEILKHGKNERQIWQGIRFNGQDNQTIILQYYAFILKLYHSEPISGFTHLHGKKDKALIHIGVVDIPVTLSEIQEAIKECLVSDAKELDILGWEWEMGIHDAIENGTNKEGIKIRLKLIPNEVMDIGESNTSDSIRFFDLALLKAKTHINERKVKIELTDFVIPNTELIPEEIKSKITKWSDYIDYWAVDFNFLNETFINQWTSFRTKTDRSIKLQSEEFAYETNGKYRVMIKIIDIFGIDTSQIIEIEVH